MERFLTPRRAAETMGLPLAMLRTKIKRGEVPGFQHGNRFYVNLDQFAQKLEEESRDNVMKKEVEAG